MDFRGRLPEELELLENIFQLWLKPIVVESTFRWLLKTRLYFQITVHCCMYLQNTEESIKFSESYQELSPG